MPTLKKEINQSSSDQDLISLLSDGYELALDEIMFRYKSRLYYFIFNYIKDDEIAYDILQETFTKVYFKAYTYNPKYNFSTWIHQIAINLCRDHNRKKKLKNIFSLDDKVGDESDMSYHEIIADPNSNIEDLSEFRQSISILDKQIRKLPHKLKTALILFTLEDFSQEECAKILNITVKAVEARVYRARKILAKKIITNSNLKI